MKATAKQNRTHIFVKRKSGQGKEARFHVDTDKSQNHMFHGVLCSVFVCVCVCYTHCACPFYTRNECKCAANVSRCKLITSTDLTFIVFHFEVSKLAKFIWSLSRIVCIPLYIRFEQALSYAHLLTRSLYAHTSARAEPADWLSEKTPMLFSSMANLSAKSLASK